MLGRLVAIRANRERHYGRFRKTSERFCTGIFPLQSSNYSDHTPDSKLARCAWRSARSHDFMPKTILKLHRRAFCTTHYRSARSTSTLHTLTDCRNSQFSKFPASSLFVFCAAKNKSDFRQIAECSPKPPLILHLALYFVTPLCVLSATRYLPGLFR